MKRRRTAKLQAALACAALAGVLAVASGEGVAQVPKADDETQAILRSMAAPSNTMASVQLETLKQSYAGRHHELVQQLFLFGLTSHSTREGMLPGVVIQALGITKRDITLGVVPLLEAGDGSFSDKARNWLGEVELGGAGGGLDFSVYAAVLEDPGGVDVSPLIRHMMRRDRAAAQRVLTRVLGKEEAEALCGEPASRADP